MSEYTEAELREIEERCAPPMFNSADVDRAAEALHAFNGPWCETPWDALPEVVKGNLRVRARAVIAALKA